MVVEAASWEQSEKEVLLCSFEVGFADTRRLLAMTISAAIKKTVLQRW